MKTPIPAHLPTSTSLRSSRLLPDHHGPSGHSADSEDSEEDVSLPLLHVQSDRDNTGEREGDRGREPVRTPSIYTYTDAPTSFTPSKSSATTIRASPSRVLSPRFSDTPEYIPTFSSYSPSRIDHTKSPRKGSLKVKYPGLNARGSAPALLPSPVPSPLNNSTPAPAYGAQDTERQEETMPTPDLITLSPPVPSPTGALEAAVMSIPTRPCAGGVFRKPSFKITIPRCPNPQDLAAQVGRASGTGPPGKTYSRTPYPEDEGVDYLSRALDRVEVRSSISMSRDGSSADSSRSPRSASTDTDAAMRDSARSSIDVAERSSGGLPVVQVSVQDEMSAGGIKWVDPWLAPAVSERVGRGRQLHRGGRGGRGGGPRDVEESESDREDTSDSTSGEEDEGEEEEHLLRENLGAPCSSPRGHRLSSSSACASDSRPSAKLEFKGAGSGFQGMLARVGRRLSGQGKPRSMILDEVREDE